MVKKIYKKLVMLFVMIIFFFIGENNVKAEECVFNLVMPHIDSKGVPSQLEITYKIHWGWAGGTRKETTPITNMLLKCDSEDQICRIGIKTEKAVPYKKEENHNNPYYPGSNNYIYYPGDCTEKYIEVESNWGDTNSYFKLNDSDESKYKNNLYSIYEEEYDVESTIYHIINMYYNDKNHIVLTELISSHFYNFGAQTFVNTKYSDIYPEDNYKIFEDELSKIEGGEASLDKIINSKDDREYPLIFDTSKYNELSYTKTYYDITKSIWYKYMDTQIRNNKPASELKRRYIFNWFKNVSRYLFEEDINLFRKYFVYLYEDYPSDLDGQDNYDNYLKTINAMIDTRNAYDEIEEYNDQNCSALCPIDNDVNKNACKQYSTAYINCVSADKECTNSCVGVASSISQKQCYEGCMKSKLGEEAYNTLIDKKKEREEELEEAKEDAINQIIDSLSRVDLPNFDGIEFNGDGYRVECDDVVVFHKFYNILRIFAPILVIVFGTLDYTKSVMGADENKVLEFRKKFPKRLILLLLLIFVPIIINIMLDLFAPFDAERSASLMECIIRGR